MSLGIEVVQKEHSAAFQHFCKREVGSIPEDARARSFLRKDYSPGRHRRETTGGPVVQL
jgi:hypothetical protein